LPAKHAVQFAALTTAAYFPAVQAVHISEAIEAPKKPLAQPEHSEAPSELMVPEEEKNETNKLNSPSAR